MKKQYTVQSNNEPEEIIDLLADARRRAKQLSKLNRNAIISQWLYDEESDEYIINESWNIIYENGKEIK